MTTAAPPSPSAAPRVRRFASQTLGKVRKGARQLRFVPGKAAKQSRATELGLRILGAARVVRHPLEYRRRRAPSIPAGALGIPRELGYLKLSGSAVHRLPDLIARCRDIHEHRVVHSSSERINASVRRRTASRPQNVGVIDRRPSAAVNG